MSLSAVWRVIRTLIITYFISAILLVALSFALYRFHLQEPQVNAAISAVYVLSCFAGGLIAGKVMKTRRFLWGLLIGLLYFLFLFFMSAAQSGGIPDPYGGSLDYYRRTRDILKNAVEALAAQCRL